MPVFRVDRIASVYLFHPLQRLRSQPADRIPILMYHAITEADESGRHPYYRTATSARVFEEHLSFLRENNFQTLTVGQAATLVHTVAPRAQRPVVITFDDGFHDFYTHGFPLLNKYGFTATVFLPTAYIGVSPKTFNGMQCLTWSEVRELRRSGIDFGSHTVTHPQLRDLEPKAIREELHDSKQTIEDQLGCPATSFAYPYAFPEGDRPFQQQLRAVLDECGYENGVSTVIGRLTRTGNRYFISRLPINSCDDPALFRAKLDGGYDWLRTPQRVTKVLKRYLHNG